MKESKEEAESSRLRKRRFVARMDLDDEHPLSMNNEARAARHDMHDVIDTKTNKIAWRGDCFTDGAAVRSVAAALNAGRKPPKFPRCPYCGESIGAAR